jgi:acylphosphatase
VSTEEGPDGAGGGPATERTVGGAPGRYQPGMDGVRFRITGRVQGVGFRAFTRRTAVERGVVGWCRNTSDGAVEGEAWAEPGDLQPFLDALHHGPPAAHVEAVETAALSEAPVQDGFTIRR